MSQKALLLSLCLLVGLLLGCSTTGANEQGSTETSTDNSKNTKVKLPSEQEAFQLIESLDAVPEDIKDWIETVKKEEGVHSKTSGGVRYVLLSLGERPNPGYGIQLIDVQEETEYIQVTVRETFPDANKYYPQVIAYPYLLGTAKKEVKMKID